MRGFSVFFNFFFHFGHFSSLGFFFGFHGNPGIFNPMGFFWDFYSRLFEKIPWDFFPMGLGFFKKFTHAPGFFDKGWDSIDIRKNVLPKKIVYQTVAG